jgi:hypothetical protein
MRLAWRSPLQVQSAPDPHFQPKAGALTNGIARGYKFLMVELKLTTQPRI